MRAMLNPTNSQGSAMELSRANHAKWAKGEPLSMSSEPSCSRVECSQPVVTSLGETDFCFEHFCSRCYELLERSNRGAGLAVSSTEFREELFALDECARRVLEISFSRLELNNLDRARLLDILLWAGDLTNSLRHRRTPPPPIPVARSSGRVAALNARASRSRARS